MQLFTQSLNKKLEFADDDPHKPCRSSTNMCALSLLVRLQPNCYVTNDVSKCCLNSHIVVTTMRVPMPMPMPIVTMPRLEQDSAELQTQVPIIA